MLSVPSSLCSSERDLDTLTVHGAGLLEQRH